MSCLCSWCRGNHLCHLKQTYGMSKKCAAFDENEYFTTEMIENHTYQSQDVLEQIKGISHGVQQVSEELTALRHPTIH